MGVILILVMRQKDGPDRAVQCILISGLSGVVLAALRCNGMTTVTFPNNNQLVTPLNTQHPMRNKSRLQHLWP